MPNFALPVLILSTLMISSDNTRKNNNETNNNQAGLLFTNSIMILHRKRFLSKYGLDDVNNMGCNPSDRPFQVQAIGLLQAVHYLKIPVIMANIVAIIFELLLGGG